MQDCCEMEGWYAAEADFPRKEFACRSFDAMQHAGEAQTGSGLLSGFGQQAVRECHSDISERI